MPEPGAPSIVLRLRGRPCCGPVGAAGWALARKDAALLAIVALDGAVPRERLARWLWPDADPAGGLLNLRQRLHKLKQLCGGPLTEGTGVLTLAAGVQVDDGSGAGDEGTAPDEGADLLLATFDYGDLPPVESWLAAQRARLLRRRVERLAAACAQLESAGALAAAIERCEYIVAAAPWHEHSWRRLMRLHYLRGDRAAAVAAFERFERQVCVEQGIRPAAETLALLRTVELLDARPPGPSPLPVALVRPPRLVGRDGALRAVEAAWAAQRPVLVLGEGGIGKSRLLEEALRGRVGALLVRARPGDQAAPYATVTALMRRAVELFAPEPAEADRRELARLLPEWDTPAAGSGHQQLLWPAFARTLALCRQRGLTALVVDDLHLADEASLELLRWLLGEPQLQGMQIALAARAGEGAAALSDWAADSARVEVIPLRPWSHEGVRELLQSLALRWPGRDPDELADALYRHAGGHPFFTLETLKLVVLDGDVRGALPLPAAAEALVGRRLTRLSAVATQLLQVAALAGGGLPPEAAASALEQPLLALAPAWRELEHAQLMQAGALAHDLVREAVLAQLPAALRPVLHVRLAQALQGHPGVSPARLAGHWQAAARWEEAARAWHAAATDSRRAGRLAECGLLHEQAAAAWAAHGEHDAAFDERCRSIAATLRHRGETAALQRLQEIESAIDDRALRRAHWQLLRAECLLNLARYDEALQASAVALADAPPGSNLHADAETLHGRALALTGRAAAGLALLQRAVTLAASQRDGVRELAATAAWAHALQAARRTGAALRVQQRALQLALDLGDPVQTAAQQANLAALANSAGETALCRQHGTQALARLHTLRTDGAQLRFCALLVMRSAAASGRFDEAMAAAAAATPPADAPDPAGSTVSLMARNVLAAVQVWLGQPAQALQTLPTVDERAHPVARAVGWLARQSALHAQGLDPSPSEQALHELLLAHPALREDLLIGLSWARFGPASEALAWLARARTRLRRAATPALARTVELRLMQRLLESDPAAAIAPAQRLAGHLHLGLHSSQYPPEAWWLLACALRDADAATAERCRQNAVAWIGAARLPDDSAATRQCFLDANPHNRVVLASRPIGPR